MANYSTTKLTPGSTTKFPANNGNTPGYVEGADLTTKTEFNEAISSLSDAINAISLKITVQTFPLYGYSTDATYGDFPIQTHCPAISKYSKPIAIGILDCPYGASFFNGVNGNQFQWYLRVFDAVTGESVKGYQFRENATLYFIDLN